MNTTIDYYNQNADSYISDTINVDFDNQRDFLLKYLNKGATILDLGCGSGRDSKAFIEQGFSIVAIDGSKSLCDFASKFIGQEVRNITFDKLDYDNQFDGIWACASLLHLSTEELQQVLPLIIKSCKQNAYIYMSFKYGDFEGVRNGRFFNYMNEEKITPLLNQFGLQIVETKITGDVRNNRENEQWLNIILKRRDINEVS